MLVEQTAGNQVPLHLPKLLANLSSLCSTGPPLLKLVLGELPMTKVRCRDPRSSTLGPRSCTSPAMQPAAAVSLVCWALAGGTPTCFGATSLAWPVRAEPPFNADGHIIFCKHLNTPIMG